jgi:acetyl-CoA carboxylase carboxyltransferase component
MTFVDKVNDLQSKKQKLELGGGQERIDQQHKKGKLTARERISKLFDEGSFVEVGTFAETHCIEFDIQKKKAPGDGVVTGYGTINGRPVFAAAQDFTVIGGSLGAMHAKKIVNVMNMAAKTGAPFIALNDSFKTFIFGSKFPMGVSAFGSVSRSSA